MKSLEDSVEKYLENVCEIFETTTEGLEECLEKKNEYFVVEFYNTNSLRNSCKEIIEGVSEKNGPFFGKTAGGVLEESL